MAKSSWAMLFLALDVGDFELKIFGSILIAIGIGLITLGSPWYVPFLLTLLAIAFAEIAARIISKIIYRN